MRSYSIIGNILLLLIRYSDTNNIPHSEMKLREAWQGGFKKEPELEMLESIPASEERKEIDKILIRVSSLFLPSHSGLFGRW